MENKTACCVQDCGTKTIAKRLCQAHYQQWRNGKITHPNPPPEKPTECTVDGCYRAPACKGLCLSHYGRKRHGRGMEGAFRAWGQGGPCSVDGCPSSMVVKGMCAVHWGRTKRGLDLHAPIVTKLHTDNLAEKLRLYAPEGEPDECWEWTRGFGRRGYGAISVGSGRSRPAHVVAWEVANGKRVPKGMVVRHTCDNPPCTNPAHLLIGTNAENSADMVERGRQVKGSQVRGAKLTESDIPTIRALAGDGMTYRKIAEKFNVSRSLIGLVVSRKIWKHVA